VVGADNLLVLRAQAAPVAPGAHAAPASDIRAWLAAGFGLIHGFGFAYVLKEFGLPQAALAWSLFAFNVGVEIGQLLIVTVVAGSLMFIRKRSPAAARVLAIGGSVAVIIAGVYWFIERVFLT
jgi:cytochrome b subunit of formate dehydrogenase